MPDELSTRPLDPTFNIPTIGYKFDDLSEGSAQPSVELDWELAGSKNDQFGVLFEPHGPFSAQDFRNPEKEDAIVKKLGHNHALIAAQLANLENRITITETSADRAPPLNGLPKPNATVTNNERPGLKFRLDWFYRAEDQSRVFTVGAIGDPGFMFLGPKKGTAKQGPLVAP
ncbi:hypothetical protein K4K61_011739 [Colletotrichum sp. SAR11_59]|nr:hypothetical protein K4K61_011739 [Colletotrichum sp. SAR11_59]